MKNQTPNEFETAAATEAQGGFVRELWGFLRQNKKWWLLPILIMLLLFGVLIFLSGSGLAPFIYTLF
jgi:drug/metabolite transporter superfamily protein YnfA